MCNQPVAQIYFYLRLPLNIILTPFLILWRRMIKTNALILILFCSIAVNAQGNFLVLKKRDRPFQHFWIGSRITIKPSNSDWLRGVITRITPDSFYMTQEIIRYSMMGYDTLHISGLKFSIQEIEVMPTKKQMIYYKDDRVIVIPGHTKYMWIKNGLLFQAVGAGYLTLNIANHLKDKDPPFAKKNLAGLGIAAGLFFLGEFLHLRYDPLIHLGKKYRLEAVILDNETNPNQKLRSF
jgi:hypothetical protein